MVSLIRKHSVIGLDLGARLIKAAQLELGHAKPRVSAAAIVPRIDPETIDAEAAAELVELLQRQGFRGRQAVAAAPASMLQSVVVEVPEKAPPEARQAIARGEFKRLTRLETEDFEMVLWPLLDPQRGGEQRRCLAMGVCHEQSLPVLDALGGAGLDVLQLVPGTSCVAEVVARTIQDHGRMHAVLDLGWSRSRLTIWQGREKAEKHFTIYDCGVLDPDTFRQRAAEEVARAESFRNAAFVFLHGFNVTFENALYRTAQMAFDINFDGPAFLYSWPAVGKTLSYATDMDSATQAAPHLDAFVDLVLSVPGIEKLHLVAHSMGNAALAEFMRRVGTRLQARGGKSIDQLILAAPDIDVALFDDVAEHFARHARGVTLYACSTGKALIASKEIRNDYPRAGDVPEAGPVISPLVDTIDVSAVGTAIFSLNHSLYAEDRGLLDDLAQLMLTGVADAAIAVSPASTGSSPPLPAASAHGSRGCPRRSVRRKCPGRRPPVR